MTGPSYRGTANRGTENRGTENRGIGNRGLGNGARARQQGSAVRQSAAATSPPTGSQGAAGQSFVGRTVSLARDLALAQARAEALHDVQRPYFVSTFKAHARGSQRLGMKVPIRVVPQLEFDTLLAARDSLMRAEWRTTLVRQRPAFVQKELEAFAQRGSLSGRYPTTITPTTRLHPRDADLLDPPVVVRGRAGAFFDPFLDIIVVRSDQVDAGVIAHETCHAYASAKWNSMQLMLSVYDGEPAATELDEGVTSELAGLTLFNQAVATQRKTPGVAIQAPTGYAGYGAAHQARAGRFMQAVDGTPSTPGPNAVAAYVGGDLAFRINETDLGKTQLRFGKKLLSLQALL